MDLYRELNNRSIEILNTNNSVNPITSPAISRPLGSFGDITLNEIITKISGTNVSDFISSVDVNTLSLAASAISAGFLMKQYVKFSQVHYNNIRTGPNFNNSELPRLNLLRMRGFVVFSLITIPAIFMINPTLVQRFKDVFWIQTPLSQFISPPLGSGSDSINTSGLFVFLSNKYKNFKNKNPEGLTILISILAILLYSYLSITTDLPLEKYLNIYLLVMSPILIIFCILNLYLLNYFRKNPL